MAKHSEKGGTTAQHTLHRWPCTDQAQRYALPVVAADRLKLAWQQDNGSLWVLLDNSNVGNASGWRRIDAGNRPWHGVLAGASGYGDPDALMSIVQRDGNVAATPSNITTSIARCSAFRVPADMVVDRIRAFGVGVTTSIYRVALYRYSDLARLMAETAFTTAVDTWVSIGSNLNVALTKDVLYFIACSVNAAGATAGPVCKGDTLAATTGRVNTAPNSLPGSMALSGGFFSGYEFEFPVTTGALPNPAATPVAQSVWTGGMPAFWLDSADV